MAPTRSTRRNASAPPVLQDPRAPHEVNLKKPAHWGAQLPQATTAMMQDDFAAMGFAPETVEELVNAPEPVRVDGFAQPHSGGHGEAVEGTGVTVAQKRKMLKTYKGLVVMKGRGDGDVKDWMLYDPHQPMLDNLPALPPLFKQYLLYEPGNAKVVAFNPGSGNMTLKKTPECLIEKGVKYTPKGPVIVDMTPEQASRVQVLNSIETGEYLMSGALPASDSDDEAGQYKAEKRAKESSPDLLVYGGEDLIRDRKEPAQKGGIKGGADGRPAPPEIPPPKSKPQPSRRTTTQRGRDIPAIPPPTQSPEPRAVASETLGLDSAVSSAPKKRSSRRQQHQKPELAIQSTESPPASPPKKRRRDPDPDAPSPTSAPLPPPAKRHRGTTTQPEPTPPPAPPTATTPAPKKQRTRRPPPPPRTQPAREGKGKRAFSEPSELAPAPKKRKAGADTTAPVVVKEEVVAIESARPPAPPAGTRKRKATPAAAEGGSRGVKRKDSGVEKAAEAPKAKRARKASKPVISEAVVVDSDE